MGMNQDDLYAIATDAIMQVIDKLDDEHTDMVWDFLESEYGITVTGRKK